MMTFALGFTIISGVAEKRAYKVLSAASIGMGL
jgi:hypothetical protein